MLFSKKAAPSGPATSLPLLRIGMVAGALLGLYVLYNVLWTMVMAGVALGVIAGMGVVATAAYMALPLGVQWLENKLLSMRKAVARANPIEQLQNFALSKAGQVETFGKAVKQVGAQITSLTDMVADRKRMGKDVTKQEAALTQMQRAHETMLTINRNAQGALRQLNDLIEDKKFEFKFAEAGQKAMASMNATDGKNIMDAMLADEAFSAVRDNFNEVFASLEVEAAKLNDSKQLDFGSGMTIDVSAIKVPVPQLEQVRSAA